MAVAEHLGLKLEKRAAALDRPSVFQKPASDNCSCQTSTVPLTERIAALRLELAALEQQQRDALVRTIAAVVGPGVAFSAAELWTHGTVCTALQTAFDDAGIRSPRQLGKRLRQLSLRSENSSGLTRIGADHDGAIWIVT